MIITISRQSATNGLFVAQLVAERLGYRVFDGSLVDEIARRLQVDPGVLSHFDEQTVNPVSSILWEWRASISTQTYIRHVREVVKALAKEGNAIIIGRGANYILRGPEALHVRLVAPLDLRVAMYCAGEKVDEREARRWIKEQDLLRAEYIRKYFNQSIDDPVYYDMTINLDGFSLEATAGLITDAAMTRREEKLTPEKTLPVYIDQLAHHRPTRRPMVVEMARRP